MKKINKLIIAPTLLSTLMIASAPYAKIYLEKYNTQDKTGSFKNKNNLLSDILDSFGSPAFAECDMTSSDACVSVEDVCMAENTTVDLAAFANAVNYENYFQEPYITSITIQDIAYPESILTPATITSPTFNNYSNGIPTEKNMSFEFQLTSSSVGPNEGPSQNGRKVAYMYATAPYDIYDYEMASWLGYDFLEAANLFTVTVDHVNIAPTINDISPINYSETLASPLSTQDIPVSFQVSDLEQNNTTVTVELSSNNFSTIIQSQVFNGVTAGQTINHTFVDLPAGNYEWRAVVVETDAEGYCTGFSNAVAPNNLTVISSEYPITLNAPAITPTPTNTPEPTSTPTNTPQPTSEPTPTVNPTVTSVPTVIPTQIPTVSPTLEVTPTIVPTSAPTSVPTLTPTIQQTTVSGHLFNDSNKNGIQDPGESNLPGISIIVTDSSGKTQTVVTDENGNYTASVAVGQVTISVDKSDPDLPAGSSLTTGSESFTFNASAGNSNVVPNVGYAASPTLQNTGKSTFVNVLVGVGLILATFIAAGFGGIRRVVSLVKKK